MKIFTEYLYMETKKKREYINITDKIEELVKQSDIEDGMALVSAMHITAGVYVNDAESGLIQDIDDWLQNLLQRDRNTGITERVKPTAMPT